MAATFPELEVARKYVDPLAGPPTYDSPELVPQPTTEHTLEVVRHGKGVVARFARELDQEAWIAHRYRDGGVYRREPVLAIPVRIPYAQHHDAAKIVARLAKQMERTVAQFNEGMRRAERIASGKRSPWWRRIWEAVS